MAWLPISLEKIYQIIAESEKQMSEQQLIWWKRIRIQPDKWTQDPWGNEGGGFWVVGILWEVNLLF